MGHGYRNKIVISNVEHVRDLLQDFARIAKLIRDTKYVESLLHFAAPPTRVVGAQLLPLSLTVRSSSTYPHTRLLFWNGYPLPFGAHNLD